jgi:hypothetical protein
MKWIRIVHLCLGCLFAPLLIFFCASGAWQLFGLHRAAKKALVVPDGSYVPPEWMVSLSSVHLRQGIDGLSNHASPAFRWFALALALGMIVTAVLGLVMAFRRGRGRWVAVGATVAGLVLPVLFLWLAGR